VEELAEGVGRGFLRVIKWIVINAFIEFFMYGYGYIILKIITFGKYPKPNQNDETLCTVTGFIALILTIAVIMFIHSQ